MRDVSPQSPEARRKRLASMRAAFGTEVEEKLKPKLTAWEVVKRVAIGVYNDGFIHDGNPGGGPCDSRPSAVRGGAAPIAGTRRTRRRQRARKRRDAGLRLT